MQVFEHSNQPPTIDTEENWLRTFHFSFLFVFADSGVIKERGWVARLATAAHGGVCACIKWFAEWNANNKTGDVDMFFDYFNRFNDVEIAGTVNF